MSAKNREERTNDELRDELRDQGLETSGSKQEMLDRLAQADRSDDSSGGATTTRLKPLQVARRAAEQLAELTGRQVDATSGLRRTDDGWHVVVEVVEVRRTPPSTDVLGAYAVEVDADGDLVGYERLSRYIRGQSREE